MENIYVQFDAKAYQKLLGFLWAENVTHKQWICSCIVARGILCLLYKNQNALT